MNKIAFNNMIMKLQSESNELNKPMMEFFSDQSQSKGRPTLYDLS